MSATTEIKHKRNLFRFLLAVMAFYYFLDAVDQLPGDFFDWLHWAVSMVTVPMVLVMGWRYSK